jgi:TDG/mug DNA glycosylase family protein
MNDRHRTGDPHRATLDVYEQRADDWLRRRRPDPEPAAEFTRWLGPIPAGSVLDLGCGPGWHLPELPPGSVGLDGAAAMLEQAVRHAPDAPLVRADLRALPVARGALHGVWAERSLVHLDRRDVPMALWDLHRAVRVGGGLCACLFEDDVDHRQFAGDDVGGRWFSGWTEPLLRHVLEGAGFDLELLERSEHGDVTHLRVWARRARTLADTVSAGMRLLLVGLNPSLVAADAGVGFHRAGNRAWPALAAAGLATVDRDPVHLLRHHRIGMTDLVKHASARAAGLTAAQYAHGVERLDALCAWLRPDAVCVVGLTGWRAAVDRAAGPGPQTATLGGRPVYLMPNPSGVNTHVGLDELAEHLRAAARLADAHTDRADSAGAPA